MKVARSFVLLLTTVGKRKNAFQISQALIQSHLAACVNIVPGLTSIYRWKGRVSRDPEFLLLIKTSKRKLPQVEKLLRQLHPYEVPEMITLTLHQGSSSYLAWMAKSLEEKR